MLRSQAELARIALTSLSSLPVQRSLHRERAHEQAVAFSDVVDSGGKKESEALQEQVNFLTEKEKLQEKELLEAVEARDPRAENAKAAVQGEQGEQGDATQGVSVQGASEANLMDETVLQLQDKEETRDVGGLAP